MGLILDSSILVGGERQGENPRAVLEAIGARTGNVEIGVSVVTLMERAHGAVRANTEERQEKRRRFLGELMKVVPVYSVTPSVALRAGQVDGETQADGVRVPLADLLIGVTALELDFEVATTNARHFGLIPGLRIVRF